MAGGPHRQGTLPADGEQVMEISLTMVRPPREVIIRVAGKTREGASFEKKVLRRIR